MEKQESSCYTCLSNERDLLYIYSPFLNTTKCISEILNLCLGVNVDKLSFPKACICQVCFEQLQNCYFFFKQCHHCEEVRADFEKDAFLNKFSEPAIKPNEAKITENKDNLDNVHKVDPSDDTDKDENYSPLPKKFKKTLSKTRNSKTNQCPYCKKMFSSKYYTIHLKCHDEEKSDDRDITFNEGYDSNEESNYKDIGRNEINTPLKRKATEKSNLCAICGKSFKCSSKLKMHIRSHTGEKPNSCDYCDMKFNTPSELAMHERVHTGEKPYECNICGQKFARRTYMKHHMMSHKNERPYVCELCNKGFITSYYLKIHIRTHTGEKPFECEVCHKRFPKKIALKYHAKVHSEERPFLCSVCGRAFRRTDSLKYHITTHSKVYIRQRKSV